MILKINLKNTTIFNILIAAAFFEFIYFLRLCMYDVY